MPLEVEISSLRVLMDAELEKIRVKKAKIWAIKFD
jgi:hypothetical protein